METTQQQALAETEPTGSTELSLDEMFEILKNERRRFVLQYLQETTETELAELADHVTAIENDTDIESITSAQRKRVYVGLYQFHLPKMAKMGVIEFDQDRGIISLTSAGSELIDRHQQEQSTADPRPVAALVVAGGIAVLVSVLAQSAIVATTLLALQTAALAIILVTKLRG